ncbi:MAG: tetratricopeptide repeat protein, partial [Candidatus Brocadiaceae bacterium]
MRHDRHLSPLPAALAVCLLLAAGCGPLVGFEAVIRPDDMTRLEREVLGERADVMPGMVLLPLRPGDRRLEAQELRQLYADHVALEEALSRVEVGSASLRAWQVVSLHNRGVLSARLGEIEEARQLLEEAVSRARSYWLPSLQWQIELTLSELEGGEQRERLERAARILQTWPPPAPLDHALEDVGRIDDLYGRLISATLDEDPEAALRHALNWKAVRLAHAVPPGGLFAGGEDARAAARHLAEARSGVMRARENRCRLAPGDAVAATPLEAAEEGAALRTAIAELRATGALGGLLVADPADAVALREALTPGTALLMYAPAGEGSFGGFLLGPDVFQARRVEFGAGDRSVAAEALVRPFLESLGEETTRLYLSFPAELSALAWTAVPFGRGTLSERFELAFLGGPSDLLWAFRERSYGRQSVLISSAGPGAGRELSERFAGQPDVQIADAQEVGKEKLALSAALADIAWFGNALVLEPGEPGAAYLSFPGGLGRLQGLPVEELSSWGSRAGVVVLAHLPGDAFAAESFMALRVLTRALIAGGVPSVIYGTDGAAGTDFWADLLKGLRGAPPSGALQESLAPLETAGRERVRLYGFAGLNESEYAEFARLDFNDTFARAREALESERYVKAASGFLDLRYMARAMEFASASQKETILANLEQYLVRSRRGMREHDAAAEHQRTRIAHLGASGQAAGAVMALEYQSLGALLTEAERFEEAAQAYARSIDLLHEHGGREEMARVLGELGKSLDRAARYDEALETFQEALTTYRSLEQEADAARQHQRIGAIYLRRLDSPARAQEHFERALEIYRSEGDVGEAAETLTDVGLCRRAVGDFSGALERFGRAEEMAEQEGLRRTMARALTETGNTRWLRGEYQQALQLVSRSNEIAREMGIDFQLNVNYQLLALIYWELNDYERAHQSLDVAIEAARRAGDYLEIASAHNNRGIIYRRQGAYPEALESFAQALEVDRRLRSRWGQAYDHRNVGMTLRLMGDLRPAAERLQRAAELSREIGDRVNLAKALLALGDVRLDQGRPEEAEPLLNEALREAREVYLPEVEWRALRSLGRMHRLRGAEEAAWEALRDGVDMVEELQATIKVEEFRSGFLSNKMDLYEEAVDLLLDSGRAEEAFLYGERSRARKFMDVLAGRSIELKNERERELYERQRELARGLRGVRELLAREGDEERREKLAAEQAELKREYADVLLDIQVAHPALGEFVSVEAVSADRVQQFLPEGVALLAYYLLEDGVVVWAWHGDRFVARRVPVDREELTGRIRRFRLMIQNRELLDEVRAAGKKLHELLFDP